MDIILSRKKRITYFIISGILFIVSIACLLFIKPKFSIDFSGGTLIEIKFTNSVEKTDIKNTLENLNFISDKQIQKESNNSYLIRINSLSIPDLETTKSTLKERVGEYSISRIETVGPSISKDITKKAIWAIILANIAIIGYIAYAFRSVPKPASSWRFGICAVTALIHDIFITIGIYTVLGYFFGYEIDSLFIVGILTVIGFSVHDTIVVFDRIRENLKLNPKENFTENVNNSLIQTLSRSLNTSFTVIIMLLALLFLGGESIRHFVVLLLTGIIFGTYSSLFVAPPILIEWQNKVQKKLNN